MQCCGERKILMKRNLLFGRSIIKITRERSFYDLRSRSRYSGNGDAYSILIRVPIVEPWYIYCLQKNIQNQTQYIYTLFPIRYIFDVFTHRWMDAMRWEHTPMKTKETKCIVVCACLRSWFFCFFSQRRCRHTQTQRHIKPNFRPTPNTVKQT